MFGIGPMLPADPARVTPDPYGRALAKCLRQSARRRAEGRWDGTSGDAYRRRLVREAREAREARGLAPAALSVAARVPPASPAHMTEDERRAYRTECRRRQRAAKKASAS